MQIQKAVRKKVKLKLSITGPSGGGKTYSALRLAKGMAGKGKIGVIDTENGSASLYSDRFAFDVIELAAPYTTEKYLQAIKAFQEAKYDVVIVDSLTHQWAGEGGIMDKKAQMDSRPGSNSFTNWNKLTPEHEKFKSAILAADVHLICTMRSKQEYALSTNDKGKQAPQKLGMAPIQRDGMEYEFAIVFDVDMNHNAAISKDRTSLFDGKIFQITEATGEEILKWLDGAANELPKNIYPPNENKNKVQGSQIDPSTKTGWKAGDVERDAIVKLANEKGWAMQEVVELLTSRFAKDKVSDLTLGEFTELKMIISNDGALLPKEDANDDKWAKELE